MREINTADITAAVSEAVQEICFILPEDVQKALQSGSKNETSPAGKDIFNIILQNQEIAKNKQFPLCQDTGTSIIFIEIGQNVRIINGYIDNALQEGVRQGYQKGYLRKSIVSDPLFERKNTTDNTPALIDYKIVPGDEIVIHLAAKGGGSENMSKITMLNPSDGVEGLKAFIKSSISEAGANPCPPIIAGIGIGGNFDHCAKLAKKALLREIGSVNSDPHYASLESELLKEINQLGIGPQGLGGDITVLAVHIEWAPCHIASLPVALNIQCHSARHKIIKI